MKAITIRGINQTISEKLKQSAKTQKMSVNQYLLEMIEENLGFKKKQYSRTYGDLDHLFGKWSEEEFQIIQGKIDNERKIDKELWE